MNKHYVARGVGLLVFACLCANVPALAKLPAHHTPSKHATKAAPAVNTIIWRGDYCTANVIKDLVKRYEATGQGHVTVQPFSTISGLDAVYAGSANIAGSARPSMPGRIEEQGTDFHPIAWDALVPIVAVNNPISNISLKQLHDLYLGRITDWKDLGGEPAPINLYAVAAPLDGIEYSTRLLLFHYGDQTVSVPRLYINNDKLQEAIAIDPHALGMSTLSAVAGNPKVKMLSVEGVQASDTTIAEGTYPLYSTMYLAARSDNPKHEAVEKFIAFVSSDSAKTILRQHDLVPYADAPDLMTTKQVARVAYVDAHLKGMLMMDGRPVSAPNATVDYVTRTAPTAAATLAVKADAARLKAPTQPKPEEH